MLYPSGPLMTFSTDLQEISPEKNLKHRYLVLDFINQLLEQYSGLKILYKPFPGTYKNDPIKTVCSDYFSTQRIKRINVKPSSIYNKVDLILWDSISTGFGESISAGAPTIVLNSKFEYSRTMNRGRLVNGALIKSGVQCLDIKSALNSFERIINNINLYKEDTEKSIKMFKEDMAFPVSKREWRRKFKKSMLKYGV